MSDLNISTKDKILNAAINLFSEKGYDGVGVDEIAAKAGIKGPSLYRHFKGKEAILWEIIRIAEAHYSRNFGSLECIKIPDSLDELINMSLHQLQFTIHDSQIKKCRRIFTMEQYRSKKIAALATNHFVFGLETMYTEIFDGMIKKNLLKSYNPEILAMEYVSTVTLCIQTIDREPERETEQFEKIQKHLVHFIQMYGNI